MKQQQTKSSQLKGYSNLYKTEVVEIFNPKGIAPIVLICEHASKYIPENLQGLGVSDAGLKSHAAWDIGAYDLACKISELIDAPLVASRISRLAYDCNRSPESMAGTPDKSEIYNVPGNRNLTDAEYQSRVDEIYIPFHEVVSNTIKEQGMHPVIITIHSFTPVYFDEVRDLELGILHDEDDRLAIPLMQFAKKYTDLTVAFNSPYGVSDNVMHTVNKHATEKKLLNVMIEVKNDLLQKTSGIELLARGLSKSILDAIKVAK